MVSISQLEKFKGLKTLLLIKWNIFVFLSSNCTSRYFHNLDASRPALQKHYRSRNNRAFQLCSLANYSFKCILFCWIIWHYMSITTRQSLLASWRQVRHDCQPVLYAIELLEKTVWSTLTTSNSQSRSQNVWNCIVHFMNVLQCVCMFLHSNTTTILIDHELVHRTGTGRFFLFRNVCHALCSKSISARSNWLQRNKIPAKADKFRYLKKENEIEIFYILVINDRIRYAMKIQVQK